MKRALCVLLCFLLAAVFPVRASALENTEDGIVRDLVGYYFHHREAAAGEIANQLEILSAMDPQKGDVWSEIMAEWQWTNEEMEITLQQLPDGLPQDNSLCIVVLGYGLNKDGSMKEELLSRLEVALRSAEKYPQAYVLCTGGETAWIPGISEAGQMGQWLLQQGLEPERLLLETESLSTTENARNCTRLLSREYPQVESIAIVSSDYHIPWGSILFSAAPLLEGKNLNVVANGACRTEKANTDTMQSQAWGLCLLAGVEFDGSYVPPLYLTEETSTPETETVQPVAAPRSVPEDERPEPVIPVLAGLCGLAVLILIPKKRKGGSL